MNEAYYRPAPSEGFSLVEIAVVMIIISVLLAIVAVPLSTQIDLRRTEDTAKQLEQIKEALHGFAISNGRLPCPAIAAIGSGRESFCTAASGACVPTPTLPPHGRCQSNVGLLPAGTLSLSPVDANGFAIDAWGLTQNRIQYAVANVSIPLGAGNPASCTVALENILTRTNGMKDATPTCLADTAVIMLTICAAPTGTPGTATCASPLTTKAPFVLLSFGKNAATGGTGAYEAHNVDSDSIFVSHVPTQAGTPSGEFDDIVTWGSLNTLFARMVQAGKLP